MTKIFGHAPAAKPQAAAGSPAIQPVVSATPPPVAEAPSSASPVVPPPPVVDVTAVLDDLAAHNKEKLDWRKSIVDLMKLVGMDSSLASRKELADDLGFTGDKGDSAKMNVWLHKEVIKQLAANGGKVPADLLD
jgi:3-oxoacyl-ACP reductase-like protein